MSHRFSIQDAFEPEEDDSESIRVYGATVISTPIRNKDVRPNSDSRDRNNQKYQDDSVSRDSDSLIQDFEEYDYSSSYWWQHQKVQDNWKTVIAAIVLFVIGFGLLIMGAYSFSHSTNSGESAVFFIAGLICFIPGLYHVVYIYLAARGFRGFDFYHLPLFT